MLTSNPYAYIMSKKKLLKHYGQTCKFKLENKNEFAETHTMQGLLPEVQQKGKADQNDKIHYVS